MPGLTDLPIELFIDNILPLLPIGALLNFSCTNHHFYELASDETFWHRKIQEDFNFPGAETARNTGWKFLYKRLSHPKVYVWGERSHGRLGLADSELPRTSMRDGVPFPVQLHIPGVRIVNLVAGGMSFHALDSRGDIYVWGALDGLSAAPRSEGYSIPSKRAEHPMRLNLPVKIRSISCGRLHCTALDASSRVWTFTSWGRPFQLSSPHLDKSSPETTPIQIESGWAFSSVLTESGDVLVYWPLSGRMQEVIARRNAELDEQSIAEPTKALPTAAEPNVIPCYAWDMREVDPVRLPAIPSGRLPQLAGAGLSDDEQDAETRLIKIAGMDNAIIGLTNKGHVLKYDPLAGEGTYLRGRWEYLAEFSEAEKVRAHPTFANATTSEGEKHLAPPDTMRITHISAQFHTFVAYSTGAQSVVLMGKLPTNGDQFLQHPQPLTPTIHSELQNRAVISVVLGDYHYGALTATGQLLTWGAFSKGALGLGDPARVPVGTPGGFLNEQQREQATRRGMLWFHPPDVRVPTAVRFDHGEKKRRERYCFGVAAAGWHMGALVIDLEPDEVQEEEDETVVAGMPGAFPSEGDAGPARHTPMPQAPGEYPMIPFGRGVPPFRLGLALARGTRRGAAGRGRGQGSSADRGGN